MKVMGPNGDFFRLCWEFKCQARKEQKCQQYGFMQLLIVEDDVWILVGKSSLELGSVVAICFHLWPGLCAQWRLYVIM